MASHTTRYSSDRHNIALKLKASILLFSLATLGYVAVVLIEHSAPLSDLASWLALERRTVSSEPAMGMVDSQAAGAATAAVPATAAAAPARPEIDYFPNRYVNQATKIEDPIATF